MFFIGRCKDCDYHGRDGRHRECSSPKLTAWELSKEQSYNDDCLDNDCLIAWSDEDVPMRLQVGPDFGCVHFKPKPGYWRDRAMAE